MSAAGREMFDFLVQREEAHSQLFEEAIAPETFRLTPDAPVITDAFQGSVDRDTMAPNGPMN